MGNFYKLARHCLEDQRQMHFGTLLALKMLLVTSTLVVLYDRFRIVTAQICVYYCIIDNILTIL